jgi:hypothetical protein
MVEIPCPKTIDGVVCGKPSEEIYTGHTPDGTRIYRFICAAGHTWERAVKFEEKDGKR